MADYWYVGEDVSGPLWWSNETGTAVTRRIMSIQDEREERMRRGEMDPRYMMESIEEEGRLREELENDVRSNVPSSGDAVVYSDNSSQTVDDIFNSLGNNTPEIQARINEMAEEAEAVRAAAARSREDWNSTISDEDREVITDALENARRARDRQREHDEERLEAAREFWGRVSDNINGDSHSENPDEDNGFLINGKSFEKGSFITLSASANHPQAPSGVPLEILEASHPFVAAKNLFTNEVFPLDVSQYEHQIFCLKKEYVQVLMKGQKKKGKKPDDGSGRISALEIE